MLPWLLATRGGAFVPCRLYEGLWRSPGMWDLRTMVAGVFSSTLGFVLVVYWAFGLTGSPRSVMGMDAVFLITCMGGTRLIRRLSRALGHLDQTKRVLISGVGDAGERIVRDI